jgi:arginyl-tRNA synthetase
VRELLRLYIHVRNLAKLAEGEDEDGGGDNPVMAACREETSKLHAGDPENVGLWKTFMPACLEMLRPIYERLDVKIDHALGESFYNPMLPGVVADMLAKGIAFESKGAVVIPNAKGIVPQTAEEQQKEEPPAIIRKRDGAFTYTTTDLATIKHRVDTWTPDAMLYVVGAPQALHFKTVFAQARRWGYADVEFQHVQFGSMLGKDRKIFSTRKGGALELMDLLDEAGKLSLQKYEENSAARRAVGHKVFEPTDAEKREIAEVIGVGAVKYADLSQNRTTDYVFDLDKMTATVGNTAAYMQYAYARCRSIFREGEVDEAQFRASPPAVVLSHPAERALALQLLRFPEAVEAAAAEFVPHLLTSYLWDLAKATSVFYDTKECHVLKAATPELRSSRLLLVDLVGRVIKQALDLLGIRVVERM